MISDWVKRFPMLLLGGSVAYSGYPAVASITQWVVQHTMAGTWYLYTVAKREVGLHTVLGKKLQHPFTLGKPAVPPHAVPNLQCKMGSW